MELEVAVARLLARVAVVDTIDEIAEVVTVTDITAIDETIVAAADEREAAVDEAKLIAVNVYPLTEGVGTDNPKLDGTTAVIKCYIEIARLPHIS